MGDFRISAKVRLSLRMDELGAFRPLQKMAAAQNAQRTTKNLNGVKDPRADLKLVQDTSAPPGVSRFILLSTASVAAIQSSQPEALTGPGTGFNSPVGTNPAYLTIGKRIPSASQDKLTVDVIVIPYECTWKKNGIREADRLSLKLFYSDFPFDPRLVRACAMELILGTVNQDDYAAGCAGEYRTNPDGSKELRSVVPDSYVDQMGRQRTNVRFQGFADTWENSWGDENAFIEIEGRDNTQLLIDQQAAPKLVMDMKKPIHEAVAQLLSHYPQMEGLTVEYLPPGEMPPVLEDVLATSAHRPNLGPQPSKGTEKLAVWDYITDVCGALGHMCRVDGTRVIVQRVRSFTTSASVQRPDDPFTTRVGPDGEEIRWRRFMWGRNVAELKTKRNFHPSLTPTNIEVRAYDVSRKKLLVGRFPEKDDRVAYAIPGDAPPDEKWLVKYVGSAGIKDEKILKRIAQDVYESLGRNELEVEIHTPDLCSYAGGDNDPDILDASAGDTIEVMSAQGNDEPNTQASDEAIMTNSERAYQRLIALGYTTEFCDAFVKAKAAGAVLSSQFRLSAIEAKWSTADNGGLELTINGKNYMEIRSDKESTGDEPNNNPKARSPTTGPAGQPWPDLPAPPKPPGGFI